MDPLTIAVIGAIIAIGLSGCSNQSQEGIPENNEQRVPPKDDSQSASGANQELPIKPSGNVSAGAETSIEKDLEEERQQNLFKYMQTVESSMNNVKLEGWKTFNYADLKSINVLEERIKIVKRLREIDQLQNAEDNKIVTKSQMALLGWIRTPVMGCWSVGRNKNMSDADYKSWLVLESSHPNLQKGWEGYSLFEEKLKRVNRVLNLYGINNKIILQHFFTQVSGESDFGNFNLQTSAKDENANIEKIGAGYIQLTGQENYQRFYIDLINKTYQTNYVFEKFTDIKDELAQKYPDINSNIINFSVSHLDN